MKKIRDWLGAWFMKLGAIIATDDYVFNFIYAIKKERNVEAFKRNFEYLNSAEMLADVENKKTS